MSSRSIIAAGNISSSPVLARRFRGKAAKEIYRCGKGIVLTGSVAKPLGFAVANIPAEATKGIIYTAVGQVGETALGYVSGIGFVRYLYKVVQPSKLKATARLIYNVACLTVTRIRIGELLSLKVGQLETLVEEEWISIDRLKRGPANHKAFFF